MTPDNPKDDLFRSVIQRRGENTEALEKREKGNFTVNRFQPITHTAEPSDTAGETETPLAE